MARLNLPFPLRSYAGGQAALEVSAGTVAGCISEAESRFPALVPRLRDEDGGLLASVNLYVNGEDIRHLSGLETPVSGEDEVSIVVAIAGGEGPGPVAARRRVDSWLET